MHAWIHIDTHSWCLATGGLPRVDLTCAEVPRQLSQWRLGAYHEIHTHIIFTDWHARTHAPRVRARARTHTHTHTHEPMLARIMCGMIVSVHLCTHNIRAHSNKNTHEP
jgi:hypothetical protein